MSTNCEVVENQASGKKFYFCRTHKEECTSSGCLEVVAQKPAGIDSLWRYRAVPGCMCSACSTFKPGDGK